MTSGDDVDTRVEQVACIAHDLRNPLSAISMWLSVLRLKITGGDADVLEVVRTMECNVAFMDHLIKDVVDLATIENHQLRLQRTRSDLGLILANVRERVFAQESRVHFEIVPTCDVPANVDQSRIERVVVNLVENALKYSEAPRNVVVRLDCLLDHARVSVIDSGPGLSELDARVVFDKHSRAHSTSGRDGAGLGLYVSRRIVEAHGGRIGVESSFGRGSCFFFELPTSLEK